MLADAVLHLEVVGENPQRSHQDRNLHFPSPIIQRAVERLEQFEQVENEVWLPLFDQDTELAGHVRLVTNEEDDRNGNGEAQHTMTTGVEAWDDFGRRVQVPKVSAEFMDGRYNTREKRKRN